MEDFIPDGILLRLTFGDASTIISYVVGMFIALSSVIAKWLPGTVLIAFIWKRFNVLIVGQDVFGKFNIRPGIFGQIRYGNEVT